MTDDAQEFAAFVRAYSRQLQHAGWLLTGDWTNAEDLVQATLTRMWQRWDTVNRAEARGAYAHRVLMTTFLGWRRRRWVGELPFGSVPDEIAPGDLESVSAESAVVLGALRQLPPHQRAVVVLCYFHDLTEQAAADALGCSVGTVKSQKSRALRTLRADPALRTSFEEDAL